jgi:hypothetical protein
LPPAAGRRYLNAALSRHNRTFANGELAS